MLGYRLLLASASALLIGANVCNAADLRKTDGGACNYSYSGPVETGDLVKLESAGMPYNSTLCLDSPGGVFIEGVNIAERLLNNGVKTVIQSDASCYSACAIMFMGGGFIEDAYFPRHELHAGGELGFHAPYSVPSDRTYSSEEMSMIYHFGLESVAKMMTLGANSGDEGGFIPFTVMIELLKTPPDKFYMVNTGSRIRKLRIDYVGAPVAWNARTLKNACNSVNGFDSDPMTMGGDEPENRTKNSKGGLDFWYEGYGDEASGFCVVRLIKGKKPTVSPLVWDPSELDNATFVEISDADALAAN